MKTIRQLHRAQGAYCSKLLMLCLFIIAGLSDLLAINLPPGDDTDDGCGGSDGTLGSVSFNFDFPILPLEFGNHPRCFRSLPPSAGSDSLLFE